MPANSVTTYSWRKSCYFRFPPISTARPKTRTRKLSTLSVALFVRRSRSLSSRPFSIPIPLSESVGFRRIRIVRTMRAVAFLEFRVGRGSELPDNSRRRTPTLRGKFREDGHHLLRAIYLYSIYRNTSCGELRQGATRRNDRPLASDAFDILAIFTRQSSRCRILNPLASCRAFGTFRKRFSSRRNKSIVL